MTANQKAAAEEPRAEITARKVAAASESCATGRGAVVGPKWFGADISGGIGAKIAHDMRQANAPLPAPDLYLLRRVAKGVH